MVFFFFLLHTFSVGTLANLLKSCAYKRQSLIGVSLPRLFSHAYALVPVTAEVAMPCAADF